MKFTETALPGVYIVEPAVYGDNRGFFMESWSRRALLIRKGQRRSFSKRRRDGL